MTALLKVENLRIELTTRDGIAPVIDDLSLELNAGETLSFVGESGCGKSMTALALMGLLPEKVGRVAGGSILFNGEDLTKASPERLNEIRGNDISMIFQEPMTSLNPVFTIGEQIAEVLRRHRGMNKQAAWQRAIELLDAVRIPNPKNRVKDYPHQLSGGQRQRICIARALALRPQLIIADESVSALDVSVQARVLELLKALKTEFGIAYLFISHDMAVVENIVDRLAVMYLGQIVEMGTRDQVFGNPQHPYTRRLLDAVPIPDPTRRGRPHARPVGDMPSPIRKIGDAPLRLPLDDVGQGHLVAEHT